jgi:ADP-ribose pyrophosphatase
MSADDDLDIETLGTRCVYENRWMRVREDAIRRRDGSEGVYGIVEKPDFVVIVPVEEDGRIHLVQQYRYPVGARDWAFPQGAWEETPGADPADMARGELQEETGLIAARMVHNGCGGRLRKRNIKHAKRSALAEWRGRGGAAAT